jgi:osmotically-inducible protein OsmY
VEVAGDTVILTGSVGSWLQRESAGRAAADAPGVVRVDNRVVVVPLPPDATQDEMC